MSRAARASIVRAPAAQPVSSRLRRISTNLWSFADTCNVYVVKSGTRATLVDFGDGDVLPELPSLGIAKVGDVVMTHHHRDQGQGLARANAIGARVWVPPVESDLFGEVEAHWQAREIAANYNVREDRFSLLESVEVAGVLPEYRELRSGAYRFFVLPTPGHTTGSVSLLAEIDGNRVAFTGDLIYAAGKVWSLAATQWTYNGGEGLAGSVLSLLDLRDRGPAAVYPSHGEPIADPIAAIDLTVARLQALITLREHNPRLLELRARPYEALTPHLLANRTSVANSHVLLSESGKALLFDFGYDFAFGAADGSDRASRRPWLYTVPALKRDFGVTEIDVAIPTHYHDDHVAGFNLLRETEGTEIWSAPIVAEPLADPERYDLPCLWYDPIRVDRTLALEQPVRWEEYELTPYPLPGHTLHAVAISLLVDGKRVLVVGDQQAGPPRLSNYVYRNRFRLDDYVDSSALYARLHPDLMLFGHTPPVWVDDAFLEELRVKGRELARLHRELLPLDEVDLDAEGALAWIRPYRSRATAGEPHDVGIEVRNPFRRPAVARLRLVLPRGWRSASVLADVPLPPGGTRRVRATIVPRGGNVRRARIAVDVTIDGRRFGQVAEALLDVN